MLRIVLVTACLAMGLLTAWVVAAIGIDEQVEPTFTDGSLMGPSVGRGVLADELSVVGQPRIERECIDAMPYRQWREWAHNFDARGGGMTIHAFHAVGWPLRCFVTRNDYPANGFYGPGDYDGARLRFSSWLGTFVYIPITPSWPGLILDSTFFALVWSLPVCGAKLGVNSLLRRGRVRRGQCPWCAFSRAGLSLNTPCPECGRPAPKRNSFVGEPFPAP